MGLLDDGSSLLSRGLEDFESRGVQLKPYGELGGTYTTSSLPANESLLHMPWLRGIRPVMRFRSAERYGAHPLRPMSMFQLSIILYHCRSLGLWTRESIHLLQGFND